MNCSMVSVVYGNDINDWKTIRPMAMTKHADDKICKRTNRRTLPNALSPWPRFAALCSHLNDNEVLVRRINYGHITTLISIVNHEARTVNPAVKCHMHGDHFQKSVHKNSPTFSQNMRENSLPWPSHSQQHRQPPFSQLPHRSFRLKRAVWAGKKTIQEIRALVLSQTWKHEVKPGQPQTSAFRCCNKNKLGTRWKSNQNENSFNCFYNWLATCLKFTKPHSWLKPVRKQWQRACKAYKMLHWKKIFWHLILEVNTSTKGGHLIPHTSYLIPHKICKISEIALKTVFFHGKPYLKRLILCQQNA